MGGQITSRDIAERAGVSQATVSRALRNSPLVRPETRERIHRVARELNYFVNRNAAGLRTQQSNTIALLLFDETGGERAEINPFFLSMLSGVTRSASELGYDVLISLQQLTDDWHLRYEVSNRADGIIVLGYGDYVSYREKLQALAEANARFVIWGPMVDGQPGASLCCDNIEGGRIATAHLTALGRQRIAFLGRISERSPEHQLRHQGYLVAHDAAGLSVEPKLRIACDSHPSFGYRATQQLLASGHSFDAIFAVTDAIAVGAIQALQQSRIKIPEDVAVVGFDDLPMASHVTPQLTTIRHAVQLAGELLVNNIVRLIEGGTVESEVLPTTLIVRQSCGGSPGTR
ncbi:MAG: LacI family DNA-binding transcriptional regulator [Pseudomonadota bacterium]